MNWSPNMNVNHTAEEDEEEDLFYFESDHLALKGNTDYSEVLKTIFILESQRAKAIQDYDKVVELHKEALKDPFAFVQKLKDGKSIGVPDLQIIADVPTIQWSKFKVNLPEAGLKFVNEQSSSSDDSSLVKIEKRLRDQADNTFNKQWTTEEQSRLEELLVIYPPEPIEFRRFKKIAAALGNRTVQQVSSRIQKYFLKLYRAGLPIPGRIPKYAERIKKSKLHNHQRYNHFLFKPSTFFPQLDIPVVMNETEPIPGPSTNNSSRTSLSNYLLPEFSHPEQKINDRFKSDVDIQLSILRKVKQEKLKDNSFASTYQHFDYKCDYCNEEPISGVRWHCKMCEGDSIDFCSDCVIAQMYSENPHPLSHELEPVKYDNTESGCQSDNSSSESVSGSAFDSSNKNFGSNYNSSLSESETEEISKNHNHLTQFEDASQKIKQEETDLEDHGTTKMEVEDDLHINAFFNESYSKQETLFNNECHRNEPECDSLLSRNIEETRENHNDEYSNDT